MTLNDLILTVKLLDRNFELKPLIKNFLSSEQIIRGDSTESVIKIYMYIFHKIAIFIAHMNVKKYQGKYKQF